MQKKNEPFDMVQYEAELEQRMIDRFFKNTGIDPKNVPTGTTRKFIEKVNKFYKDKK